MWFVVCRLCGALTAAVCWLLFVGRVLAVVCRVRRCLAVVIRRVVCSRARGSWCAVRCALFVVCCSLLAGCILLVVVSCVWFVGGGVWFVV